MDKGRSIPLKETISSSPSVVFLNAEVLEMQSPFAMVWYSLKGTPQEYALRLDLDKQVFLDHLDSKEDDKFVQESAPKIADYVGHILYTEVS
ncbi:MAG: hypothetical protein HYU46_10475 [Deltaproteobacteria bacterium]|nr:hypothetical protein [Deltaproteobacteria bacterium]MBI2531290.1 hypothetical protein [Deltaproteobacteria bacterium]